MGRTKSWPRICASLSEMFLIGMVVVLIASTACVGMPLDEDQEDGFYDDSGEGSGHQSSPSVEVTSLLEASSKAATSEDTFDFDKAGVSPKVNVATPRETLDSDKAAFHASPLGNQKDSHSSVLTIVAVVVCIAIVVVVVVVVIAVVVKRKQRFYWVSRNKEVSTNDSNTFQRQYAKITPSSNTNETGNVNLYSSSSSSSTFRGTCNPIYDDV